jgi:hypothetical protein
MHLFSPHALFHFASFGTLINAGLLSSFEDLISDRGIQIDPQDARFAQYMPAGSTDCQSKEPFQYRRRLLTSSCCSTLSLSGPQCPSQPRLPTQVWQEYNSGPNHHRPLPRPRSIPRSVRLHRVHRHGLFEQATHAQLRSRRPTRPHVRNRTRRQLHTPRRLDRRQQCVQPRVVGGGPCSAQLVGHGQSNRHWTRQIRPHSGCFGPKPAVCLRTQGSRIRFHRARIGSVGTRFSRPWHH